MISLNCKYCSKEFEVWPYRIKEGVKFCSQECEGKSRRNRTIKNCLFCKIQFSVTSSKISAKFCSHSCQGGYYKSKGSPTTKHGKSYSSEHETWSGMKKRCYNQSDKRFKIYGGRGIKVCDEWRDSFINFYKDMGDKPSPEHSIDRIDVNGDYTPENCRWATREEQANNKRNNIEISIDGVSKNLKEWYGIYGVKPERVRDRIAKGWSEGKAVTQKPRKSPTSS